MKTALVACGVFLVAFALLAVVPDADIVPAGVRRVLDDVAGIW